MVREKNKFEIVHTREGNRMVEIREQIKDLCDEYELKAKAISPREMETIGYLICDVGSNKTESLLVSAKGVDVSEHVRVLLDSFVKESAKDSEPSITGLLGFLDKMAEVEKEKE